MSNSTQSLQKLRAIWLTKGVAGLLCTGAGLCLLGEAIVRKINGDAWFWLGTLCLGVFNFGLCLLFDSYNYQRQLEEAQSPNQERRSPPSNK